MTQARRAFQTMIVCAAFAKLLLACAEAAGPETHSERCHGEPFGQGTCGDGQLCGSLPEVGYDYCLPAAPCPPDMVTVLDVACAYPCTSALDCEVHGLRACAENTLGELIGEPYGWCTP